MYPVLEAGYKYQLADAYFSGFTARFYEVARVICMTSGGLSIEVRFEQARKETVGIRYDVGSRKEAM